MYLGIQIALFPQPCGGIVEMGRRFTNDAKSRLRPTELTVRAPNRNVTKYETFTLTSVLEGTDTKQTMGDE